jgi:hypothetical protein
MRLFLAVLLAPVFLSGQTLPPDAVNKAKLLTVMVDADTRPGSGIIFAVAEDRVYIATANHVVRSENVGANEIEVSFNWLPGEPFKATLLAPHDPDALDLAVIVVSDLSRTQADKQLLPFELLGKPAALTADSPLWAVGHPGGALWQLSDQLHAEKPDGIRARFRDSVPNGYSGGPLLDRDGLIIGMGRTSTEATRMDRIVEQLTGSDWNFPVGLKIANKRLDELLGKTYSGTVILKEYLFNWFYVGRDFERSSTSTIWQLRPAQVNGVNVGYWICDPGRNRCWEKPPALGPLIYWNADGKQSGYPGAEQLFVFERVGDTGDRVRIKRVSGSNFDYVSGVSFGASQPHYHLGPSMFATVFSVDFP